MPKDGPVAQRLFLGRLFAVFGLIQALAALYVLLSSGGPVPIQVSASSWSAFYFAHFVALTVLGYGWLFWKSARTKVFHGGPMLDYTIGLGALAIASSFGRAWIPGVFLIAFGLRLMSGRALL